MDTQSLTQTINIVIGDDIGSLANTGTNTTLFITIASGLIITAALFLLHKTRGTHYKQNTLTKTKASIHKPNFRSLTIFTLLTIATIALTLNLPSVSAAPTLTLDTNQTNLTVTVPEGGGTASTTTTLTTGTANPTGYTLTANLSQAEPGIAIKLKGGNITTPTDLTAGAPALTLKTTTEANPINTTDTTKVTLEFTIDSTVTAGKKELKLNYNILDNHTEDEEEQEPEQPAIPTTMQSMTADYCQNNMTIYDGSNEEAVITLHDPRGAGQDYQVAKLADNNCWMLDNLKLGSTSGTLTLTPADTNIASTLTLPQLTDNAPMDTQEDIDNLFDTPFVFGPVPGDTGSGETNYGYLYNWFAATAGESRTTMPGDGTNDDVAPYSICPANWRLPTGGSGGEFSTLDIAWGGTGEGSWDGEPNIAQWNYNGAFKGVFSGYWIGEFDGQGDYGVFWSASAVSGNADYAFYAYFGADEVNPAVGNARVAGFSVRCLLQ